MLITRMKRILIPSVLTLLLCACGGKPPVETDTAPLKVSPASQSVAALGGWWATGLDGGGSSAVWLWDPATSKGGIVNRPSDSKGERSCLSYWIIKQK